MIAEAVMCMALNLYHEARGEKLAGVIAVGNVVMNRVESDKFPDSVCDVIYQRKNTKLHQCQFSWYCDGKSDTPADKEKFGQMVAMAGMILEGGFKDNTDGATYYHATYVHPHWAKSFTRTRKIGYHIFYKDNK